MSNLKGKVAIVTGASKGIGGGVARALGAAGAAVVVNYARDKAGADKVVADITAKGGKAVAIKADVSKPAEVEALFAQAKSAFGRLDVLVNNAGVYAGAPIDALTEDHYRWHFDVNVLGTLLATREATKYIGETGGSIINLSSVASEVPFPTLAVYSATKGAVDALTKTLATELGGRKIRVNTIAPGGIETEGLHAAGMAGGDMEQMMIARTPLGRIGQPDDIARVALFLASDDAGWVTGQRIEVSGGFH